MLTPCVSLDLEMTGVNPDSDAIIEVGLIRFDQSGPLERFSTLVAPGRSLPKRIEALTGITAAELATAPTWDDVAPRIVRFLAGEPLVGQNIGLDLSFLRRRGLEPAGPVYDTAELGELLLPGRPDYSLRSLARLLQVDFPVQHRAMPDAEAAMQVFLALRDRLLRLDGRMVAEIVRLSAAGGWRLSSLFAGVAAARPVVAGEVGLDGVALDIAGKTSDSGAALVANQALLPLNPGEAAAVFAAAGDDPTRFPAFEHRPEQLQMAEAVAAALNDESALVVEAGTGTGKSLAYLVPAACYALRNGARVLVSTNTINLQEQITGKDTRELYKLLEAGAPADLRGRVAELRVTQLKGRRNYVCLQRLLSFRRAGPANESEARFLTRVMIWLQQTETGDRAELNLRQDEEPLWSRICAQNSTCFSGPSYYVRNGTCQLLRARKRAEASHIVIANHALLLSDLAAGGRALPQYDRLIVDEAHNLEDEATNQFGFQAGQGHFGEYLDGLYQRGSGRETGTVVDVHDALRLVDERSPGYRLHALANDLGQAVDHARVRIPDLFQRVNAFITNHGENSGEYDNRLLLTPAKRAQPEWQQVELAWEDARLVLVQVEVALEKLVNGLSGANGDDIIDYDTLLANVTLAGQQGLQLRKGVDAIVERPDGERIAWMTTNRATSAVSFSSAPLHVGDVLADNLFGRKRSVILTSATLSAGGTFAYIKDRLGVAEAEEVMLGSPFDYKKAALVLLPVDMPEPNYREYQPAVEKAVIDLCTASRGRALVLFTSHGALRATHAAVRRPLEKAGLRVLGQNIDGTAKELVEQLRTNPNSVLLGTSSFWEGVDVVGEALSLLIIAKLPFAVPNDPVFAARSALLDDPFMEYAVPQAGLRFKQGFGRLIRHRDDRGVMVVLDRRLTSKRYGRVFLASLPACSISQAPLAQLPSLVARWLPPGRGRRGGDPA